MMFAKRLQFAIVELLGVALMRHHMIHFGGWSVHTILEAINAPRFCSQLGSTHVLPLLAVIKTLDRRVPLNSLGGMLSTAAALTNQLRASWITALTQTVVWHGLGMDLPNVRPGRSTYARIVLAYFRAPLAFCLVKLKARILLSNLA